MIALVILLKSRIDAVDLHERKVGGGRNVRWEPCSTGVRKSTGWAQEEQGKGEAAAGTSLPL